MPDPRSAFFQTNFLPFADLLIREIASHRGSTSFEVFTKEDGSPVTSADYLASRLWVSFLQTHFPDDRIVSEESVDAAAGHSTRTWFVDPIDGTRQFIDQSSDFYSLCGMTDCGRLSFGFHLNPHRREVIAASEGCGVVRYLRTPEGWIQSTFPDVGSVARFHLKGIPAEKKTAFFKQTELAKPPFPSPHVHMMAPLMEGYAGFATFRETWYWDLLAPAVIMREAGFDVQVVSLNGASDFSDDSMRCKSLLCLPKNAAPELRTSVAALSLIPV